MSKRLSFLAAPLFALAVTGAAPLMADDAPTADTVIATVNGTEITLGHMILMRNNLPQQYAQLPDDVLFQGVLDQLVHQTILMQSYDDAMPDRVKTALENEERSLMAAEAIQATLDSALSDDVLRAAYEEQYADATPGTEYNAAHILVETEDEARAILSELEGGADFATLAREKSTGPSGPDGGNLGWFGEGMMVPSFEEAVMALDVGDLSAPIETQFGWHVIKLNETRVKDAPAFEDVRGEIESGLQSEVIEARIGELTEKATIDRSGETGIDPAILKDTSLLEN
ncbi:peptidylprolyl isomerase [Aquicoccus porphyridii]|uniref:Parvulin-like PPIase n=1 Tax=Aquicoccus porphyridii TaxID=1852029 RepID=A0A5A9Z519_9RHOB|nr:peptidylprolyl isomerase [Aquicoccus porphyridii]KAA0912286.1 peptidylprolyl isomerase [Aquicoccus porphyridii]RAI54223.1 peptidylprolyl isomerase [Rhodobacteraceae bacterium AsT-22]